MIWIYDIEVYTNYFAVIFKNIKSKELKEFILFRERNDIDELHSFINDPNKWLVGYNSLNFDNQLLNYISKFYFSLTMSSTLVITRSLNGLAHAIIEDDCVDYKYNLPFQSLDLMKLGFYKKSLKLLAVSLKWPKIQELPLPWDTIIEEENLKLLHEYNLNDVLITEALFHHLEDNIKLRFDLSKRYNINVYTESDSGIANRLLEKFYSEASGLPVWSFRNLRTERKFIKFDWVVFDEVHFCTNTLDTVLEEVKNHVHYEKHPFFSKVFTFDGIRYKMGVGGLHSVDTGAKFEETETTYLIDADIGSMYPTTLINYQLTPAHLGSKFLKNFTELRDERLVAKKNKDMTPAEGLKIVLNSAIGKTLSKYHWLYDPLVNLQVTINGQLFLLMLIEKLSLVGFKTISANTDGITVIVPKDRVDEYYKLCKDWESETRYGLEYAYYTKYCRRDVNNYIAQTQDGYIKAKGIFIKDAPKKFSNNIDPLNKGFDKPIISIALHEFFINDVPIKQTIEEHNDIYDFCIAKKIDKKFTNELHYISNGMHKKETLQKSIRYYVSTDGGTLLKVDSETGEKENYEVNRRVTVFNDYIDKPIKGYNIDYGYYINYTQKIINEIINPQLSLWDN